MEFVTVQGVSIPALGLGSWRLRGATGEKAIRMALELGYRHIDTAQSYGNEDQVGSAIQAAKISRDDLFVTTKVTPERFTKEELPLSVTESLSRLGLDYVDLLLLHWPNPAVPLEETLGALAAMKDAGRTRFIGVSNFTPALIDNALSLSPYPLLVNQVEYHPFLEQSRLLATLREQDMALTAYSPLAKGRVPRNERLQAIGTTHGKSAAQVALRWLLQQDNVVAIPKSERREHLEQNLDVFDFSLSDDEMAQIHALAEEDGRIVDPAGFAPDWGGTTEQGSVPEPNQ